MKVDLLIIDPQKDFCSKDGSLFVPGADEDCTRLAAMIDRIGDKVHDIYVTLDTHNKFDIAHPSFWMDAQGRHPAPFTIITLDDVKNGVWRTSIPAYKNRKTLEAHGVDRDGVEEYLQTLIDNNRYALCVWPPHCLIGSDGARIESQVYDALNRWEDKYSPAYFNAISKGSNIWTEHYSAVQADVPDPEDSTTWINMNLIKMLQSSDLIGISGQALSHCVANTISDVADNFGEENIKKFVLLEDTCSNVAGFEQLGEDFVKNLTARGMQVAKSTEFLA